jgi:prepilin-type N-terminal cleavage/methylation domain-containing protein
VTGVQAFRHFAAKTRKGRKRETDGEGNQDRSNCLAVSRFRSLRVFAAKGFPQRLNAGYTLIELLVALVLLAVISGGITMAFSTSLRAFGSVREQAGWADERRALVERLQADLRAVWLRPGSQTTWFLGLDAENDASLASVPVQGDMLEFTTARPVSPDAVLEDLGPEGMAGPQGDVAQVVWGLETGADGGLELVRWERTPPDPETSLMVQQTETVVSPGTRTVISRRVTGIQLRYFDGIEWLDGWDSAGEEEAVGGEETSGEPAATPAEVGLPLAVEVALYLAGAPGTPAGTLLNDPTSGELPALTLVVPLPEPVPVAAGTESAPVEVGTP